MYHKKMAVIKTAIFKFYLNLNVFGARKKATIIYNAINKKIKWAYFCPFYNLLM